MVCGVLAGTTFRSFLLLRLCFGVLSELEIRQSLDVGGMC